MRKSMLQKCVATSLIAASMFGSVYGVTAKADSLEKVEPKRYVDTPVEATREISTEYVNFASKQMVEGDFPYGVPYYYSNSFSNACGPIAGTIVAGYYDKYYENLIPDYTAYYEATGRYKLQDSINVPTTLRALYILMRTNQDAAGVSEQECLDGLKSYVEWRGYSLSYTAVKTLNSSFNFTTCKNQIDAGNPVLLFCHTVQLLDLTSGDTQDIIVTETSSVDHIVVAFGYSKYYYYDENGNNFRTDTYLRIATGWSSILTGYIKVNDGFSLDSGFAVDIY